MKQKPTGKSYNSEIQDEQIITMNETRKHNEFGKNFDKEKKFFRSRLSSQNESIKSRTTMIESNILKELEICDCSKVSDGCLRRYFSSYFLVLAAAVAADLVTLPVAAAFFSTSLMTPTATV